MKMEALALPGMERIRARFLEMLDERLRLIDALFGASETGFPTTDTLKRTQEVLHKIAGTAGTLGMPALGESARECEEMILSHVEVGAPDVGNILRSLGRFVDEAERALSGSA